MKRTLSLVLPYAAWMALMSVLPQTAGAYALRGAVTAALLVVGVAWLVAGRVPRGEAPRVRLWPALRVRLWPALRSCLWPAGNGDVPAAPRRVALSGFLVGLLVFVVWIAPESWLWPDAVPRCVSPAASPSLTSPYAPATCGWALTLAKLAASAFVISVAEELFFRKWLVEFAGFGWMLVLFGVEHMRWDLGVARGSVFIAEGVFAGLCYGLLAKKYGIVSAIVAHAVTNLVLGLYIIHFDKWFYW